jgi:hypothetical protein
MQVVIPLVHSLLVRSSSNDPMCDHAVWVAKL